MPVSSSVLPSAVASSGADRPARRHDPRCAEVADQQAANPAEVALEGRSVQAQQRLGTLGGGRVGADRLADQVAQRAAGDRVEQPEQQNGDGDERHDGLDQPPQQVPGP